MFSPLLTSEQCHKILLVNSLVQKFRNLEKKGNKKALKKVQIDLSTSLGDLAGPVQYRARSPPPQPMQQELPSVPEQTEPSNPQNPEAPWEQEQEQVIPSVAQPQPQPVEADKFKFDLSLDPGDPANRPKVPMLKPVHDGSNLVGFAVGNPADTPHKSAADPHQMRMPSSEWKGSEVSEELIDQNTENPPKLDLQEPSLTGTKPKKGLTQQQEKVVHLEQIPRRPAFEIYHDPQPVEYRKPPTQRNPPVEGMENLILGSSPPSRGMRKPVPEPRTAYGGYPTYSET